MPLSIYQIPLQKEIIQAEFHPGNNSIIILYANGELQSISPEGKKTWAIDFDCEPVAFRINTTGDLIALLGTGKLYFYNLLTLSSSCIDIDEKLQLLEFYKDSVLLSGFQDHIILMKQNGSVQKSIEFDSLICQFKPIPATDNLIIYNQDHKLLCADMDGKVLWQIEHLVIHGKILVSGKGHTGYFIMNPNDLIRFNVNGESFYEICDERMIKSFSISWDGKNLLALDSENTLTMFDENAQKLWEYSFEHNIKHMRISLQGDFFLTVDNDDVLSCYAGGSTEKNRDDFLEMTENKRVMDKETLWTIRPGGFNNATILSLLTVSPDTTLFGLVGKDGGIYFYDEQEKIKYQTSFTSIIKHIGISDNSQCACIYGGNEAGIINFQNDKMKYILFEKAMRGKPIVNYYHQKIYTISREEELLIYDFEGHLINTISLNKKYQKGISCEAHGIALFSEQEITVLSVEGEKLFNYSLKREILNIFYTDPLLICLTRDHTLIRMDLLSLKAKIKSLLVNDGESSIVSIDPLFIVTGDRNLCHLDSNLSITSKYNIESMDSLFFLDEGRFFEIIKKYNGFYCYNDKREMIWRYSQKERILESALMRNGLVFTTEDSVGYIEIRKKEESPEHFSQYLEI